MTGGTRIIAIGSGLPEEAPGDEFLLTDEAAQAQARPGSVPDEADAADTGWA